MRLVYLMGNTVVLRTLHTLTVSVLYYVLYCTGLCRFLVIKFLKCNRFIYHTASWTLFEISKASHNVHIVGYPHMH